MKDALKGIAGTEIAAVSSMHTVMRIMKANVSASVMGWSFTTAFLQPFGLLQSAVRIGPKYVLRGLARWAGGVDQFESATSWVMENSEMMRLRAKTFNRELFELRSRISKGKGKLRTAYEGSLFYLMQKMQFVADVPTWIGAYEKAIDGGHDDATAYKLADRAVIESQGGGQTKDLTEFQRKHEFLTMFYSYFSVTYNLTAELTARTDWKKPLSVAAWMGDMILLNVIPAIGPALIISLMQGSGDDDDAEDWAARIFKWQVAYLAGLLPGIREFSGMVDGYPYSGPPVGRIVSDTGRLAVQLSHGELDAGLATSVAKVGGDLAGVPVTQLLRSAKGWEAWADGEAPPTALLVGPPTRD